MPNVWIGIDAGKTAHHCVVVDREGQRLLSRRISNDESVIQTLIDDVATLAEGGKATWAKDLNSAGAALLLALLVAADQAAFYICGRVVYHAAAGYRGEGKTDAKDAAIIADQARMRRDRHPIRIPDETAAALRILTGYRTDRMRDRTRTINRIRALLNEFFPALERALDLSNAKGTLILLTGHQTPDGIRRVGRSRLEAWLRKHGMYNPAKGAETALDAAHEQHVRVTGQNVAASCHRCVGATSARHPHRADGTRQTDHHSVRGTQLCRDPRIDAWYRSAVGGGVHCGHRRRHGVDRQR